jgi:hypothetical protein
MDGSVQVEGMANDETRMRNEESMGCWSSALRLREWVNSKPVQRRRLKPELQR